MIHDLTLIRPVLSNTFDELTDYVFTFYGLFLLQRMNRTKSIPSAQIYNDIKRVIKKHSHYLKIIVTDSKDLMKERKMETQFSDVLVKLYDLRPKLIEENNTVGIQTITDHIDVDSKLIQILKRNLTYDEDKAESLLERANQAIDEYSKQIRLD